MQENRSECAAAAQGAEDGGNAPINVHDKVHGPIHVLAIEDSQPFSMGE
jgi:hypothetical protein